MGVVSQPQTTVAVPPGKTQYLLYRRLSGIQRRSGRVWKISLPTGIRSPDRQARSRSLYRLRKVSEESVSSIVKVGNSEE